MKTNLGETITAISTPLGEGGIGIVRMSGDEVLPLLQRIFLPLKGRPIAPHEWESHQLKYGYIVDVQTREKVDEVMVVVFKAPRSYTREDMAEISCHGGNAILTAVLELAIRAGARLAEPGEFTKRAFLNGRIDLTQAEAVVDLIRARGPAGRQLALSQLEGKLSQEVKKIREKLIGVLANLEISLDFPEEDLGTIRREEFTKPVEDSLFQVREILKSFEGGRILREGATVVIVGRPNVGKSSLMNRLLQEERAIVSPHPGTTRDIISEDISLGGIAVRLKDTAGLGISSDPVEMEGVRRTCREMKEGDLMVLVIDSTMDLTAQDEEILSSLKKEGKPTVIALNKIDLGCRIVPDLLEGRVTFHRGLQEMTRQSPCLSGKGDPLDCNLRGRVYPISALDGTGIQELRKGLEACIRSEMDIPASGAILCRLRHMGLLQGAQAALVDALGSLNDGLPEEIAALGIAEAIDRLGELVGIVYSDDLLEHIFSEFCIGK